jgi:hypothetical protein
LQGLVDGLAAHAAGKSAGAQGGGFQLGEGRESGKNETGNDEDLFHDDC